MRLAVAILIAGCLTAGAQEYNANWYTPYVSEAAVIYLMRDGSGSNLTDYSSNGRTATNRENVAWGSGYATNQGALVYAGSTLTNYTQIGNLGITGAITIAWWQFGNNTNVVANTATSRGALGNFAADAWGNIGYGVAQRASDNQISVYIGNNGSSAGDTLVKATNLVGWNYMTVTYQPAVSVLIYQNAKVIASQAVTRTWVNKDPVPWVIAADQRFLLQTFWGGPLADVMVIPEVKTPAQVLALYTSFTSPPPATAAVNMRIVKRRHEMLTQGR